MTDVGMTTGLASVARDVRARHRTLVQVLPVYVAVILLFAVGEGIHGGFVSLSNIGSLLLLATFTAVVAFGQGVVILVGGFDLSVAWTMTMAGVLLTAQAQGSNTRGAWLVPIILLVGAGIGFINGLGVAIFDIAPIIMTLAVNYFVEGVVMSAISGTPSGKAPEFLVALANNSWGWLPWLVVFLVVFTVLGTVLLRGSGVGRRLHLVGYNRTVATLSGVGVRRTLILAYVLSGVCAAAAGMLAAGYTTTSALTTGDQYLLPSIAAVVIGGASVFGGLGHYPGTVGGAIFLTVLTAVLAAVNLSDAIRTIITGVVILLAVLIFGQRERIR